MDDMMEAVPDSRARQLVVVSAYRSDAKRSTDQVLNISQSEPQRTPEAPLDSRASFAITIPQIDGAVNGEADRPRRIEATGALPRTAHNDFKTAEVSP